MHSWPPRDTRTEDTQRRPRGTDGALGRRVRTCRSTLTRQSQRKDSNNTPSGGTSAHVGTRGHLLAALDGRIHHRLAARAVPLLERRHHASSALTLVTRLLLRLSHHEQCKTQPNTHLTLVVAALELLAAGKLTDVHAAMVGQILQRGTADQRASVFPARLQHAARLLTPSCQIH